ncbi:MAG TPA: hypothetical protein VMU31_10225 [Rhizomicrobium sp.]|nr:hypothetical protein [Rhizomicrobium sp.]
MKIRIVISLAAACLLSACSEQDWNHALSFTGLGGSHEDQPAPPPPQARSAPPAQVAAAPIPEGAQPQPNAFCESVASEDAKRNDFDPPTQQRVFVQSYRQCVAVFGDVTK